MSFKVFVTLATVLFARYSASTLPEASETLTTQQDTVEGTNNNQCPQTLNQDFGERSEPLCTAHCLLLGHGVDTAIRKRFAFAEADKVMNNKPPVEVAVLQVLNVAEAITAADMTDVQQFEAFMMRYSGNPQMLASAEKAYRRNQ